ncbi:MAG: cytochrome C [Acidobacteriota bacterium]|nr:cytochrome C [Acidobacteriota bacterium]
MFTKARGNHVRRAARMLAAVTACALMLSVPLADKIRGSKHDFSSESWNPGGEICRICHIPHDHGRDTGRIGLLWNHQLSEATYQLYSSNLLENTPEQPRAASKQCLCCHDGTVAVDAFDGDTGSHFMEGGALIGTDLRATHPISIAWSHEPGLNCSNCHNTHSGKMFDSPLPFFDGRVECPSCHEPHNDIPLNTQTGDRFMLRKSMLKSELCFHCHNK